MNHQTIFGATPKTNSPLDRFLEDVLNGSFQRPVGADSLQNQPSINVAETPLNFRIELAAPGFQKENFQLKIEADSLTVFGNPSASVNEPSKSGEQKFKRREFAFQEFKQTFSIPKAVNQEAIAAVYELGILTLTLPKKTGPEATSKTVAVS